MIATNIQGNVTFAQLAAMCAPVESDIKVTLSDSTFNVGCQVNKVDQLGKLEISEEDGRMHIHMANWVLTCDGVTPSVEITHDMLYILGLPYTFYMCDYSDQDAEEYNRSYID